MTPPFVAKMKFGLFTLIYSHITVLNSNSKKEAGVEEMFV